VSGAPARGAPARGPAPADPLAYTVVGAPPAERVELPELRPYRNVRSDTVEVLPDRRVPDVLWFEREGLRYGLAYQETRAPLVFLIGGLELRLGTENNCFPYPSGGSPGPAGMLGRGAPGAGGVFRTRGKGLAWPVCGPTSPT
jgi:hypothetical protein